MRGRLQNTAQPKPWWGNPGLGFLDNTSRQGAGMLQIEKAVLATTRVEPGKLSLGESQAGGSTQTLPGTNEGSDAVTYNLSSVKTVANNGNTFAPGFNPPDPSVAVSAPAHTPPPPGSAGPPATIHPP